MANATWAHTNVYGAGKLLATYDNVGLHFHFADWLGTNRVQMNADGAVEETCLSLPFGDSLSCSGPGTDATEHHFTGKERDAESGLDYFGARYFGSNTGRWMSPDWAAKAEPIPYAKMDWPQSFNLYGYVENNPLSVTDADGHNSVADCKEDATKCQKTGELTSKSDQIRKGTQNTGTSTEKAIPAQQTSSGNSSGVVNPAWTQFMNDFKSLGSSGHWEGEWGAYAGVGAQVGQAKVDLDLLKSVRTYGQPDGSTLDVSSKLAISLVGFGTKLEGGTKFDPAEQRWNAYAGPENFVSFGLGIHAVVGGSISYTFGKQEVHNVLGDVLGFFERLAPNWTRVPAKP